MNLRLRLIGFHLFQDKKFLRGKVKTTFKLVKNFEVKYS